MAELATIARPYAQALFDASRSRLAETAEWLNNLAVVAEDKLLQQVTLNPHLGNEHLFGLIIALLPKALPNEGNNFLRVVLQNERLAVVPEVARQFSVLSAAMHGASNAVIYSAFPLEGEALTSLVLHLERHFASKLNVQVVQDSSLIGGVRVVVGDEVLDASVRARIEKLKQALAA